MNIRLISGLIIAICAAQAHAFTDEPIECEVLDPEIHDALGIMVYQHLNTSTNAREAIVQFIEDGDLVGDAEVLENLRRITLSAQEMP